MVEVSGEDNMRYAVPRIPIYVAAKMPKQKTPMIWQCLAMETLTTARMPKQENTNETAMETYARSEMFETANGRDAASVWTDARSEKSGEERARGASSMETNARPGMSRKEVRHDTAPSMALGSGGGSAARPTSEATVGNDSDCCGDGECCDGGCCDDGCCDDDGCCGGGGDE